MIWLGLAGLLLGTLTVGALFTLIGQMAGLHKDVYALRMEIIGASYGMTPMPNEAHLAKILSELQVIAFNMHDLTRHVIDGPITMDEP